MTLQVFALQAGQFKQAIAQGEAGERLASVGTLVGARRSADFQSAREEGVKDALALRSLVRIVLRTSLARRCKWPL
jgi:hypothetical protein